MKTQTIPSVIKKLSGWMLTVMILTLSGAFINTQAQVTVNPNGSFENSEVTVANDTSAIEGWVFQLEGDADATFAVVDSIVKDGSKALAIQINATGPNDWSIQAVNEPYPVISGVSYTLSLWAKASASGATANFTVGNPAFNEFGRIGNADVSLDETWQEFTLNFIVPANNDTGRTPLHFNFESNVGNTIWIDSVRLTRPNNLPVIVEAESGTLGNEWETGEDGDISFVSITTDHSETSGQTSFPGENRTISYEVEFPAEDDYDLFVKVRVGDETFDDDSFFQPNGFGEKDPADPDDWFIMNGLAAAGYSDSTAVVREAGGLGEGVWKWVNISRNNLQGDSAGFRHVEGDLTKIFQIGAREDGLQIDKFAFGSSELFFTVENLENGTAGSETDPREVEASEPIAEGKEKWLGNIYSSSQIDGYINYWNQVTPENAGKWGSVEGTRDQMNWSDLDAAYDLAKDNGFPFRFHVLVWGGQQPGWINDLSPEEQFEEIEEWFDAVAERYPEIDYLEVVNEPLHQRPDGETGAADYWDALGGPGETGRDWVIKAFEMARDKFPSSTKLMINDYGIIGSTTSTNNYLEIIELLKDRGLIDRIGLQGHAFSTRGPGSIMRANLTNLAAMNRPIQVTEFDIDGNPNGTDAESDQTQLEDYQRIFPVIWEHPGVEGVTLWGWRPGLWRNAEEAYLVRNNGQARPALNWLRSYVDTADVRVDVSNEELLNNLPEDFKLYHNYPNPFNPVTQIQYDVPRNSDVKIQVYDVTGRLIQTLVDSRQTAGSHTVQFNAARLSSGVYFYRIEAGSFTDVKRMMLIK